MAGNLYDETLEDLDPAPPPIAAPQQVNPYDDVIRQQDAGSQQQLRTSLVQADATTPDRAADVQKLSTSTGIPAEIIDRNYDTIRKRATFTATPYQDIVAQSPAVATWAAQPANAAVAKDDLENLGALEWLVTAPSRAFAQGIAQTRYALLRSEGLLRPLSQAEQDQLGAFKANSDVGGALGAENSWFRGSVTGLMKTVPMLFGAALYANKYGMVGAGEVGAAGALAGSILPGAGTAAGFVSGATTGYSAGAIYGGFKFGAQLAAGQAYDEYSQFTDELGRPIDPGVAKAAALATGVVNGALMAGGFGKLLESIPGVDKLGGMLTTSAVKQALLQPTVRAGLFEAMKTFGGTLTYETANMVGQRAAQILIGDVAKERSGQPFAIREPGETAADLGQTATAALRDFSLLTAIGPASGFALDRVRAREAIQNATYFKAIGEGVTQSKTFQRLPDALQAFVAQATQDGPVATVYAPVDTWSTYWQGKGIDPAQMAAEVTGNPDAFDQATRTGEDLAIPTSRYATKLAATEHNAFFANELRLAPEQMNAREGQAFEQQLAQQQAAAKAEAEPPAPAAQVRESVMAQLEAAGIERGTAESYATLYEHAFQTLGERAGVDPTELFKRYGLTIERPELAPEGQEGETVLNQQPSAEFVPVGGENEENADRQALVDAEAAKQDQIAQAGETDAQKAAIREASRGGGQVRVLYQPAPDNPFAAKAARARARYEALTASTAHERGMAEAFPVGPGFGHDGDAGRADASIDRAVLAERARRETAHYEGRAQAFEAGTIDAAGRPISEAATARGEARRTAAEKRATRIATAKQAVGEQSATDVPAAVWADAQGHLGGAARELVLQDHRDAVTAAVHASQFVPDEVLKDYPELQALAQTQRADAGETTLRQNERGAIRIGPNRQMRIDLLKGADLSTFLHETGHLFLETMRDLAAEPGADSIRADLAALETHLFEGAADATEQHERFARGFEAYLMEGKAPSAELRPLFARFRTWLVGVYRSLKGLNVELTPEVRGVFDRIVASDQAIEQTQADGHVAPLFTDAKMAGMTPEAFDAYRGVVQAASDRAKDELQTKLLRDLTREREAWWKSEREKMRADVATEAGQQPIFRALAAIQKGTHPDGRPLVEGEEATPLKLAKADLVDRYTPEEMKALRRRQLYAAEGGASPDVVAQLTGFSSGDELVKALLVAPSMRETIETATDARMREKHGDLLVDGRLPEQAQQAVYGEGRQQVIHAELKALTAGMVKGTIPPAAVINAAAEARIADMKVRDVRPGQFLMAARRAGQRAFDLLARHEDRVGAVQAKQQELINLALYREATKAQEATESAVTYLRSFDGAAKRERIGKAGADYLEQIDGLRARFDLGRLTLKEIDRRQSLAKWAAAKEASTGLPLELPEELLNEARRGHYKDLTVDELQGVRDGVRMIEHLATLKNKLLKIKAGRELAAAAGDAVTSIGEHSTGTHEVKIETRLPGSAGPRNIAAFFASHRKLSSLLRQMDGFKDGGVMWESVMRPLNEAADAEAVHNESATIALHGLFNDAYKGEETTLYRTTFIPPIGDSLSKMARLMVALNWGNEGNRQRIMDGRGWKEEQVHAILDGLDARDWKFVQGVWDHINSYWPDIAAKEKRVTGVEPEKVEAMPVQTKFGELPGGYFPIKYEHELSARAGANLEAGFAEGVKQASYVRATTQRGHTEARVAKVSEPVRLDFGVITEHLQQVIHDLTHHETLIDVGRILAHKDVQDAIFKHYGAETYDQIKGAVRDIAFGNTPAPGWYRTLNAIRANTVTATLGWNAVTSLMHSLQITRGMVRVGPGYVAHGLVRWLSSAKNAENSVGWIESQSDMMRLRWKTQQRELNEVRNTVGLDRGKVSAAIHDTLARAGVDPGSMPAIADSYFYAIRRIVQFAEIPTWIGAYEKAMADAANDPARAVALANQAVEDSMGSGQIKDLAAVQRAPMAKLLTTFYDYHNAVYQQAYELVKNSDSPGKKLVDASLLLLVPVALGAAIHHAASQKAPTSKTPSPGSELAQDTLDYGLNMFVGLRELAGAFSGRDYAGPAGLSFITSARNLVHRLGQDSSEGGKLTPGEKAGATAKAVNEVTGELFGYPAKQVERTATGIQALWTGKAKNLSAVLFGPTKGGN